MSIEGPIASSYLIFTIFCFFSFNSFAPFCSSRGFPLILVPVHSFSFSFSSSSQAHYPRRLYQSRFWVQSTARAWSSKPFLAFSVRTRSGETRKAKNSFGRRRRRLRGPREIETKRRRRRKRSSLLYRRKDDETSFSPCRVLVHLVESSR